MSAPELVLPAPLRARLEALCVRALPLEACGLLLGREGAASEVLEVLPARNLAGGAARFEVHPEDHLAAHLRARALGWAVLGAWHSHPRGEAVPSTADKARAPEGWSLIAAAREGGSASLRAWRLRGSLWVEGRLGV